MLSKPNWDYLEITTPYLDRHNDYIQLYLRWEENQYVFTDDGYTIDDLIQSGCPLDTPNYNALLHSTLKVFGVQLVNDAIEIKTHAKTLISGMYCLLGAITTVLTYQGMTVYERKINADSSSILSLKEGEVIL